MGFHQAGAFGYLPFVHLWHEPQAGKVAGPEAPALKRYFELAEVPPRRAHPAAAGEAGGVICQGAALLR